MFENRGEMLVGLWVTPLEAMTPPWKRSLEGSAQPAPEISQPVLEDLLPSPDLLRYYDQLGEGIARKIIDEFIAYGTHRRDMQLNKQTWDYDLQKREQSMQFWGQMFAFVISLTAIGGGLWLAGSANHIWTGGVITGGTVLSIVYAFLKTRKPPPIK